MKDLRNCRGCPNEYICSCPLKDIFADKSHPTNPDKKCEHEEIKWSVYYHGKTAVGNCTKCYKFFFENFSDHGFSAKTTITYPMGFGEVSFGPPRGPWTDKPRPHNTSPEEKCEQYPHCELKPGHTHTSPEKEVEISTLGKDLGAYAKDHPAKEPSYIDSVVKDFRYRFSADEMTHPLTVAITDRFEQFLREKLEETYDRGIE